MQQEKKKQKKNPLNLQINCNSQSNRVLVEKDGV